MTSRDDRSGQEGVSTFRTPAQWRAARSYEGTCFTTPIRLTATCWPRSGSWPKHPRDARPVRGRCFGNPAVAAQRRGGAGAVLPCRASRMSGPVFGIDAVMLDGDRGRGHRGGRRLRPVLQSGAFPQGGRARRAEAAGRRAAVGPFRDPAARHGRNRAARPRRLSDRLGQCPQCAAASTAGSVSTICRSGDRFHPSARARSPCHGGVPALGAGAGGGVAAGGGGRSLPAGLDGADGRTDRHPRQPDRGQPLRHVAFARLVRAHGRSPRCRRAIPARSAGSIPAFCSSPGFSA